MNSLVVQLLSCFCGEQSTTMSHPQDLATKVMNLEEHQMFLERQVEQLSTEVLELSRLLQVAQGELKRIEANLTQRKDGRTGDESSSEQA